jgi:EmrB/QacA subfamily drug resistance transporter
MFATALALIAQEFEGRERANAIGIWGATVGGSVAIGPLIGGVITEHLGWEWIFFVNVPVGIGAIALTELRLANVKASDPQPIDWAGLVTFSASLFLIIFGLIRGNPEGWGSPVIVATLGTGIALMAAFVWIEGRRRHAMLDLSLFRVPAFTGVSIVAFALSAGMFAMFLYLTLYMQGVLEFSPLDAGLRFLPLTVVSFVVAPISGRLLHSVPPRAIMGTGLILVALGLLLMHGIEVSDEWTTILAGSVVAGVGIGLTNPGIASVAIGVVDAARAGMASGINSTFRQVGIATGTAALGAIFQARIESRVADLLPQAPDSFSEAIASGAAPVALDAAPPELRDRAADVANTAFVSALNEILLVGAAIALVGGIAAWLLVRSRDLVGAPSHAPDPEPEPAPAA